MNAPQLKVTMLFFIVALAALLLILWLVDFSGIGLPTYLPMTGLRIYGLLILISLSITTWVYQKQLLANDPSITVFALTLRATLVVLSALIVYQFIHQYVLLNRPLSINILLAAVLPSLVFICMAASNALSIKNVKGLVKQLPLIFLIIFFTISKEYLKRFDW